MTATGETLFFDVHNACVHDTTKLDQHELGAWVEAIHAEDDFPKLVRRLEGLAITWGWLVLKIPAGKETIVSVARPPQVHETVACALATVRGEL